MKAKALEALRRLGKGERDLEETVGFSVAHQVRTEIQAVLRDGPASSTQLSKALRQPLSTIGYHIKELLNDGVIDIGWKKQVGNVTQYFYRVVELPYFSDEQVAALSEEDRQALMAYIVQAGTAETMASLWSKTLIHDYRAFVAWKRLRLDSIGRDELADEEAESWARKEEIEARSTNRRAKTGEAGREYVIVSYGFERSRTGPPEPLDESDMRAQQERSRGDSDLQDD